MVEGYSGSMALTVSTHAQRLSAAVFPKGKLLTKRASGTNGWLSSWGTNAHGEIAGCPPPRR
jgi:predicted ATPase